MAIHKCRICVWSNKINKDLLYCIFPRCIMKEKTATRVTTAKENVVGPKARTTCDDKKKRKDVVAGDRSRKTANTRVKSQR